MSALDRWKHQHEIALQDFAARVRSVPPAAWFMEIAPGKWSPALITEHVAISYEVIEQIALRKPPIRPQPLYKRWMIRFLFFTPTILRQRFPKAIEAPKAFNPKNPPQTPEAGAARILAAATKTISLLDALQLRGEKHLDHPLFGPVSLADAVKLATIHLRHHIVQLPSEK